MGDSNQPHVQRANDAQGEPIRAMSPGRCLEVAQDLYETAWQLKVAGWRREYSDWSDKSIFDKVRRVFLTGYAGA